MIREILTWFGFALALTVLLGVAFVGAVVGLAFLVLQIPLFGLFGLFLPRR